MAEKSNKTEKLADKEVKKAEVSPKATASKGEYREGNVGFMKKFNPDAEINDENYVAMLEETVGKHIIPQMDNYDKANNKLKAMMHSEPKMSKILADMAAGAKFEEVLPKYIDPSGLKLQEGDPDYAVWEANNKEREQNYASYKKRRAEVESNSAASEKEISKFFEDNKMDDAAKKEYGDFVSEFLDKPYGGTMSRRFLDGMLKLKNYEKDMEEAEKAAEVKARNEKIVTEKMEDEKKASGDGLPNAEGSSPKPKEKTMDKADSLTKGLRNMTNKKSILGGNSY